MAGINASAVERQRPGLPASVLGWWAGTGFGLVLLLLAYFTTWRRGAYSGDYSDRLFGVNLVSGQAQAPWAPASNPTFPARELNWVVATTFTRMISDHELLARVLLAAGVGVNAVLAAWLVYRICGSRPGAIAAGWLALVPVYAPDAVLVADGATFVFGVGATLGYLHAALSCAHGWSRFRSAVMGLGSAVVMLEFYEAAIVAIPAALALCLLTRARRLASTYAFVGASVLGAALVGATIALSPLLAKRGGVDLAAPSLVERVGVNLNQLRFLLLSETWSKPLVAEAFATGAKALPLTLLLAAAALGVVAAVLSIGRREVSRAPAQGERLRVAGALILGSIILAVGAVLLPGIAQPGYIVDPRLLYMPWVAMSVAAGAVISAAPRLARWTTLPLAVAAALLGVACSLVLGGWGVALAARSHADGDQLVLLSTGMIGDELPKGAYLIPLVTEEGILGRDPNTDPLSKAPFGVFETPWSARAVIDQGYRRPDLQVVTMSRWQPLTLAPSSPGRVRVDGQDLPLDRVLMFTFKKGVLELVDAVQFSGDGAPRVEFPVAEGVRPSPGAGTRMIKIELRVDPNAPILGHLPS